jgi:ATP-dependent Lon protease
VLDAVTEPSKFADLVAGYIGASRQKSRVYSKRSASKGAIASRARARVRQIGLLEMQDEIKSQVQEELGERQRGCICASK